jgi:hypothetical protein
MAREYLNLMRSMPEQCSTLDGSESAKLTASQLGWAILVKEVRQASVF